MAIRYLSGVNIDSNTLVVDSTNNRVGIGTASPIYKLHVAGSTYVNGGTLFIDSGEYLRWGNSNQGIRGVNDTSLEFVSGGSERMRITNTGNVGIGTTSPNTKLQVSALNSNYVNLTGGFSVVKAEEGYGMYMGVASSGNSWIQSATYDNGITYPLILNSAGGNVGIGTTSPNAKLEVNGAITFSSVDTFGQLVVKAASGATGDMLNIGVDTANSVAFIQAVERGIDVIPLSLQRYGGNVGIGTTSPAEKLHIYGTGDQLLKVENSGTYLMYFGLASNAGYLGSTNATPLNIITNNSSRIYITTSGNVGIGTTSPAAKLTVAGTTYLNLTSDYFGTPTKVQLSSGGSSNSVGIQSNTLYLYPYSSSTPTSLIYGYDGGATWSLNNAGGSSRFDFYSYGAGGNIMSITSAGNVGIGTTSPAATLDVVSSGSIQTSILARGQDANFRLVSRQDKSSNDSGAVVGEFGVDWTTTRNSAIRFHRGGDVTGGFMTFTTNDGSERMRITAAGNVGIGTTSPSQKLHVVGVGRFDNIGAQLVLGTSGVAGAYEFSTTTGNALVISLSGVNERMRIDSSGNVGIGTTNIYENLTVSNSSGASIGVGTGGVAGTGASPLYTHFNFRGYGDYIKGQISSYDVSSNFVGGVLIFSVQNTSAVLTERMRISSVGALKLNAYGSGSNTGTATQRLAVDAIGNVIEIPIGSGPVDGNGTANYVTKWSDTDTITNSIIYDNGTNVGIGTATPSSKLDVVGAIISTGTYQARMIGAAGGAYFGSMSAVPVIFQVNQNEVARFDASGQFSIATTTVQNPAAGRGNITIGGTSSSILNFGYNDSDNGYIFHNGDFNIVNRVSTKPLIFGTEGTERMRITSAGNIGVGIAAPQNRLSIGSAQDAGIDFLYDGFNNYKNQIKNYWNSGTDTRMDFNIGNTSGVAPVTVMSVGYGGNVGIGTTSPSAKLDVNGDINLSNYGSLTGGTAVNRMAIIKGTGASGNIEIGGLNNADVIIYTHVNERMRITSAGNVGIGTTAPEAKLHVVSGASEAGILSRGSSGDTWFPYTNGQNYVRGVTNFDLGSVYFTGGNVGIGNSSPTQALHVTGNARVTGAFIDSNNEAGTSGQVLSSTGSGTDWVTPATTTASSLYDLLPAARVAYNWTGQVVNDTWTDIFSAADNVLTTGTWMVQMYISDFAVGGGHYTYTYTGTMQWYQAGVNQAGEAAASEIYLHRMGHAANASALYLRTTEMTAASGGIGKLQIKGNYSNTSNTTINFKFVKIF